MSTYPSTPPVHHQFITVTMADVSTASSVWVVPGFRGKIKKAWVTINGAITTANSVLTIEIGGVAVTGATLTIVQSGSAAGDVASATPTALNTFNVDQAIEIITSGASETTRIGTITLQVEPV